jgi:RND family efflux transporter MFP subunit
LLVYFAAGCEKPAELKSSPSTPAPTSVEIVRAQRQTVRHSVGEPGQIQAFESTAIHARVPGYVKSWSVNIGDRVKKRQVLAELSVPELEAEARQKHAAIDQAIARKKQSGGSVRVAETNVAGAGAKLQEVRAGIIRATADLERWRFEFKRVEQLFRERAQTGSLVDETQMKLHAAEATLSEVQAQVNTAKVALEQAQAALALAVSDVDAASAAIQVAREDARRVDALLGFARIEAPFDGVITRRGVETGQLTQPGPAGEPLFMVARSDIVTIKVDVPEKFAPEVNPGDRAEVKLQAMHGRTVAGKVSRISWALDPKTRTIRVEIDIPNPGGRIRPGLYAYASVITEERANVLTIPTTAVITEKDQSFCVVDAGGKAVRRPIEVGLTDGALAEVVSELQEGEAVIRANAASLVDGQPVKAIETVNPPPSAGPVPGKAAR